MKYSSILLLIYYFFNIGIFIPRILKTLTFLPKIIVNLKTKNQTTFSVVKEHNILLKKTFGSSGFFENFNWFLVVLFIFSLKFIFKYFMIKYNLHQEYLTFNEFKIIYRIILELCVSSFILLTIKITLMKLEFLFEKSEASENLRGFFIVLEYFSLIAAFLYLIILLIDLFFLIFLEDDFFLRLIQLQNKNKLCDL